MPLCEDCDTWDLEEKGPFGVTLGKYDDLVVKSDAGCQSCKFFCAALQSSDRWRTRLDELSGRVVAFCNLRLDAREAGHIGMTMSADDLCLDMCVASDYEGPPVDGLDSLREIPANSQDEKCLNQISSWMSECAEHETCSRSTSFPLPKRVIEISDSTAAPRIIPSDGRNGSYVILSHHYSGEAEVPNGSELLESGLPATLDVTAFPKSVADAICVARRLGYQYLWARELCMTASELEDSSSFLKIYGQAALMLVAAAGPEANHGIFHDRNILYSPALGTRKDRYFRPRALRWMSDIEESPVAGRGWNVLERMLAPRIVHFTKRQLVWECASGCQFEGAKLLRDQDSGPAINGYDKRVNQQYVQEALQLQPAEIDSGSDDADNKSIARLRSWTQNVNALSWGRFDVPTDKLPAIGKIALVMNDGTMGEYLAGIWSKHIVSGLAWGRMFSLLTPAPEYRAPTWSWASVDGPVAIDDVQPDSVPVSSWAQKYQPKLVSHHMVLDNPSNPYGCVLEGSHIVLEAACIGFKKLTEGLESQQQAFQVRPVLDQSLMFDCSCCRPRSVEVQEADSTKFTREIEHHICIILRVDDWDTENGGGSSLLLILKGSDKGDSFTRVGYLTVNLNCWNKPVDPSGTFDALGWETRRLKLV